MTYGKRRDANEPDIIAALVAVGAVVQQIDGAHGEPDLLVGYRGGTFLIEVKNPDQAGQAGAKKGGLRTKGRGSLTPKQVKWFTAWKDKGDRIHEVINVEEALDAIGMTGERYDFECHIEVCGERCTTARLMKTCGRCGVMVFPTNHTVREVAA